MDTLVIGLLIFCTIASSMLWVGQGLIIIDTFNVLHYGATGNGQTDDSKAFLKAWDAACAKLYFAPAPPEYPIIIPTVLVPAGHSFKLQPLNFKGPCKSNNIDVQILGTILAPKKSEWKWDVKNSGTWIVFSSVVGLSLYGSGVIDGQGLEWWNSANKHIDSEIHGLLPPFAIATPTAIQYESCQHLKVQGVKHINSPGAHIDVAGCKNVTLSQLNITSPEDSPNTDGINISFSTNVEISNSFIGVGDDCIAIKGGCSHLKIHHIVCGPGHGISIGSLRGSDKVENVHVWNCSINGATNGARIKTWPLEGNGYARSISFEHITFTNTSNPIIIDQHYYGFQVHNEGGIKVSDVTYYDLKGTSASDRAISLNCGAKYCSNITMSQINITSADPGRKTTSLCNNVQGNFRNVIPKVTCSSSL